MIKVEEKTLRRKATIQIMKSQTKLPDFGVYFATKSGKPIDFLCRNGPNLFHDLVFLSGYVHDAVFNMREFALEGSQLRISMQRERWERYNDRKKLETISSQLTMEPVLSVKWQCKGQLLRAKSIEMERKFAIRSLYLGESCWDYSDKVELVFSSHGRYPLRLRVVVGEPMVLHLKDTVQSKFGRRAK